MQLVIRLFAGMLLLVASGFSACGGVVYGLGGELFLKGTKIIDDANQKYKTAKSAVSLTGASVPEAIDVEINQEILDSSKFWSRLTGMYGIFLIILFLLQIIAAFCLFINKGKKLIIVVAALTLLAEGWGIYLFSQLVSSLQAVAAYVEATPPEISSIGAGNIIGIVGASLALLAVLLFSAPQKAEAQQKPLAAA